MYSQIFKLKNIVWYCIIPLLLFVLLKKFIDETIIHFFVKGIFSSCYPSDLKLDVATISLFIIAIIYLAIKRSRKAILGYKSIYLLVDYILIYLLYRFKILDNTIELTPFSFIQTLKLLDSIAIVSFTAILFSLIPYAKGESSSNEIEGFTVDEATKIDTENDLLNRSKFIREIATKIVNTNSPNGSFPIGVIAAWGSGKTTFLNTLSSDLEKANPDIIRIEFNAWKCSTPTQVVETFFKQLKSQLGHFSFTFESKIQDYISNLIKGTKNEGFNGFKNVLESVFPTPSIEKQYETINSEIKRIGKKIVVFIDDLDRLDKKEIYEVIRLIRNTANFSNTFYVVAYDRNYLLNAIEDINSYQAHQFLEKIFQVEFALPPINGNILQGEITKKVEAFLSESDLKAYRSITRIGQSLYDYDSKPNLAKEMILNIRDVIRFVNSFKLSYQFVKEEISFVDFYNLEIIRFKHPELFLEIYRNTNKFFATKKETNYANSNFVYCLNKEKNDRDSNQNDVSELEKFLESQASTYKLSQKDIKLLVSAYLAVFPYNDKFNQYSKTEKDFYL
jgi:predicted KAP-like P-loop ATPase